MVYCSKQDFYDYLDIDEDALSTTVAEKFILGAYNQILNLTDTFFATTTSDCLVITETHDPTPTHTSVSETYIVVDKYPIAQLSSVSINGTSYSTTNFVTYTDRIKISKDATTISNFGTDDGSVVLVYKYGVVDTAKQDVAKRLNIMLAVLDFVTTPKGRNVYMDNSRATEINQNNVRPTDVVQTFINDLRTKIDELKSEIGKAHQFS
jgi:hypothetical protein